MFESTIASLASFGKNFGRAFSWGTSILLGILLLGEHSWDVEWENGPLNSI